MKRDRDEFDEVEEVSQALNELSSCLVNSRGVDIKLRSLDRIQTLIDIHDDLYIHQKAFIDGDIAYYLTELLSDESDAVAVRAARIISLITAHSAKAKIQLSIIGWENNVSKLMLNPVQNEFVSSGAIGVMVSWFVGPTSIPQKADAALEALANISSYNFDGKIAYLDELVTYLSGTSAEQYSLKCMEQIDMVLDSLMSSTSPASADTKDNVVEILERLVDPLISFVITQPGRVPELSALGSLCQYAPPSITKRILERNTEIVSCVMQQIVNRGAGVQIQDNAARTLWHLTHGREDIMRLSLNSGRNNNPRIDQIVDALMMLIEKSTEQDEREEIDDKDEDHGEYLPPPALHESTHEDEVCFADEARSLMKAIISWNPDLKRADSMGSVQKRTSCCIM